MTPGHVSNAEWDRRAWDYHNAADTTLHNRVNAMLIVQSFLIAAYVNLTVNASVAFGAMLGIAIIVLAAVTTVLFLIANRRLVHGITYLKRQIVAQPDPLYKAYLHAVNPRQLEGIGGNHLLAVWLPSVLLAFWAIASLHLVLAALILEPLK